MKRAGIIGGGAWGTALATSTARAGLDTLIWALEPEVVDGINTKHVNTMYLDGIDLPERIRATNDYADMADRDFILLVTPAQYTRPIVAELITHVPEHVPLVICSKGIEKTTGMLMSEVLADVAPNNPVAVLSGPTFAAEVARDLPTGITLAAEDEAIARKLVAAIGRATFRPYWSDDVIGAQVGGAIKNVLAIATGIVSGLDLGENARATLITRGLAEMMRFGAVRGAKAETLMGLSGLGDLILTCSSTQSRNMSLGKAIGEGQSAKELMENRKTVAEGAHSAVILHTLAKDMGVDMPIAKEVYQILHEGEDVNKAISDLLHRPFAKETT